MITVHIYYTGAQGSALRFAQELTESGGVEKFRAEAGNLGYAYYPSLEDPETVLLVDSWQDQAAIDAHHQSPMMEVIAALREKYDLHMRVERLVADTAGLPEQDAAFVRE